ncbi:hypothetical protein BDK51DRAFT_52133 [Blyttiomyces helicus]|uniref:Glutamate--cysteine ligase n=1 Tax=Blyttiomyces helicus TaxID=388810 RepID=A0A4V1IS79_9FUNG|nr:hypothetical protein BDK51DRAFT_52133 [Blyttiomyces helicus]|eukprot:RKO92617.1 hypothetical protein BDK51DRAFT_52133 [Blyttiomyces helicus]
MGLLTLGTPMPWLEAKTHANHVRTHGIIQFLNIWNRIKTRRKDHLLWGDEVEYIVVSYDEKGNKVKLSLKAHDALRKLEEWEAAALAKGETPGSSWKPEFGRYMLEGTPGAPYGSTLKDLLLVEDDMKRRRALAQSFLHPNEAVLTLVNFPLLGCPDSLDMDVEATPDRGTFMSLFIADEAINPHARFP